MLNMTKFIKTKTGRTIMSILLGFGLATLFRKVCKGKNCITYHAPPTEETQDKIFKYGDKCYKFSPNNTKCDKKKRIYEFE
jgi:hypothetical protein